ncbi:TetR/AcrR family transcriptional regulator [Kribbella sandramycini]|uniref:AcrR family transcriptional regulator n=1 Tax=Kribbella sandramycini TaxID=60450 RepID=A0A7Y4P1A7_9ACTN|nr:TetR/AcrR family transcriptional regulator [Kribbella sandramycini]MBB6565698.1 AcrR family transcriptional regulator [Kribbella sandramycini]NOL41960.1 TetR/AcrR family transcriptional regulator [Kribbella sandramycini]
MSAPRTARERARAELTDEIKAAARRQLAAAGAESLSLRAISRELGMVSSALYRYFPSRDELLTALIIDAYDALGAAAEEAADREFPHPREAWVAVCAAVRAWARANPHEYALIYGSPIAGYQAPQTTVQPAARVPLVLMRILAQARGEGWLGELDAPEPTGRLAEQVDVIAALAPGVPRKVLLRLVIAWTQLFGMLSFELFGQLVGSMDPADDFFAEASRQMAAYVGIS